MFIDVLSNPLNWAFFGIALVIGLALGVFLKPFVGNQVIKIIPTDHRFIDLDIKEETAVSLECKKKKGYPLQRFFKLHPGFTGMAGRIIKKPVTRFLGMEGTAYTWKVQEGVNKLLGSLKDAVRAVWGEDFWSYVPDEQRALLDESRIQVTVGLDESPLTPENMRSVSEEDIKIETDRKAAQTLWAEHGIKLRNQYINMILAGGFGAAIVFALFFLGILSVPVVEVEVPVIIPPAADIVFSLLGR
jgi:hypothetical protein